MGVALSGLRVLDLTSVLMGPFATQLMAYVGGCDQVRVARRGRRARHGSHAARGYGFDLFACQPQQAQPGVGPETARGLVSVLQAGGERRCGGQQHEAKAMQRLGIDDERL